MKINLLRPLILVLLLAGTFSAPTKTVDDLIKRLLGALEGKQRRGTSGCGVTRDFKKNFLRPLRTVTRGQGEKFSADFPLKWIIITDGQKGAITHAQLQYQVDQMNAAYSGQLARSKGSHQPDSGIKFSTDSITVIDNAMYAKTCRDTDDHETMIDHLNTDNNLDLTPQSGISIVVCPVLYGNHAGRAGPSEDFEENVVMMSAQDGGFAENEADTMIHEFGHFFNLQHTFYGGCEGEGDFVDDTPPEGSMDGIVIDCHRGKDTCPNDAQKDPIHNFMDYSSCVYEFTPGQITRMQEAIQTYYPSSCMELTRCRQAFEDQSMPYRDLKRRLAKLLN